MKVLFIGGTGIISSACSKLALDRGIELWHFNRGISSGTRPIDGAQQLLGNFRDPATAKKLLADHEWDAVVDWVAFHPEQIQYDIEIFKDRTQQFVFISSASAYQTPPQQWPTTEKTPLENPYWEYSRNKIACEEVLKKAALDFDFPYTIVRPSHTYDKTLIPLEGGYTVIDRMIKGKPIVIHGDGSSLWTLTHHSDFAKGLVGILGNDQAIGEAFHITSDEVLSWDQIALTLGREFGASPEIIHLPSEFIAKYNKEIGDSLLGDKTHSMIFDNSKVKKIVPDFNCVTSFSMGAKEIADWYKNNPTFAVIDNELDQLFDQMIKDWSAIQN